MARSVRLLGLGLIVASALWIAGCKISDDVKVKADGSGSFTESKSVDLASAKALEEFEKATQPNPPGEAGMDGGAQPPKEDMAEKLRKEWKGIPGLDAKVTAEEKDGRLHMQIEGTFKTLEAYARATGLEMDAELKKNEDGSYTLTFGADEPAPPGGPSPEPAAMDGAKGDPEAEMIAALEPLLKDLELQRKLSLPGTIVDTNGTKGEDGSSVSWKATWADVKKAKKSEKQVVTFKGDDLDLKPFSVKRSTAGGGPK